MQKRPQTPAPPAPNKPRRRNRVPATAEMIARLRLKRVATGTLTIRRARRGRGFVYLAAAGTPIRDRQTLRRLAALAVPPAYQEVLYAADPMAHIQAIGRDAAGRLQYRYHPQWEKVREARKARRLARLAEALPRVRRGLARHLATREPSREFALAAAIELVAASAIRPGGESYASAGGTRGAATLLKSNVAVSRQTITLAFRAKGGKEVQKQFRAPRLRRALVVLGKLPGPRLFQFRDEDGAVRRIRAREVNAFLRALAGVDVSLKDFRTLCASAAVLDALARTVPAASRGGRRSQVLEAVRAAAEDLANTPAICRKSYVHESVVTAFERGVLERFSAKLKACRSAARREQVLAQLVAETAI